jgi:hypothetical protein
MEAAAPDAPPRVDTAGGQSQESPSLGDRALRFVETLEKEWPPGVERSASGEVVSVVLPLRYATDDGLRLVSAIKTLRHVGFSYNAGLKQPTKVGVLSLTRSLSLHCVTVQCCDAIPVDILEGLSALQKLETLVLVGASPQDPVNYHFLTNLPHLKALRITFPPRFGTNEIRLLAGMRQLSELCVRCEQIEDEDWLPIIAQAGLTNAILKNGRTTIHVSRSVPSKER